MTWAAFRAVGFRALLTFFDSATGILIGGGLFALNVALWKAAVVAGAGSAVTVVRNYAATLTPSGVTIPSTMPPSPPLVPMSAPITAPPPAG